MNLSQELRDIRRSAEAIGRRINALQQSGDLDRRGTMNPNEPLRHHKRGPSIKVTPQAFRFSYSTSQTQGSTERPVYAVKIMAGLNQLDAEVSLGQFVRKQGLHLRSILAVVPIK